MENSIHEEAPAAADEPEVSATEKPIPAVPRFMRGFIGQDEHIALQTRQHVFEIADEMIKLLAAVIVLTAAWIGIEKADWLDNQAGTVAFWAVRGLFVVVALRWLWRILQWQRARLVVTNEKVLHIHGVLNRHVDSTPLVKVDEMKVEQPILGRIFGFGRLLVDDNAGGDMLLHGLRYIPHPAAVYRLITDSARRERAFEGGADVANYKTDA